MKNAAFRLAMLLAVPWLGWAQDGGTDIELWAFRYGTSKFAERAVFKAGRPGRTLDFAWIFYALRGPDGWIVIDPGFDDQRMVKAFGIAWTDPMSLLSKAGIRPEDVSLVLLTHAHFDHIGLADRFPKARVIMSEAARKEAAARAVPGSLREFFKYSKKIDTFRKKLVIFDEITMMEKGGHAAGSAVIRLEKAGIVITGDEAYLPENWTGPRINGSTVDAAANRAFLEALHTEAPRLLVLTMHDPAIVTGTETTRRIR